MPGPRVRRAPALATDPTPEFGSVFRVPIIPSELQSLHGTEYLRAESSEKYLVVRLNGTNDSSGQPRFALLLPDEPPRLQ
eukprot:2584042-Prymnesium_polylepis.1